MQLSASSLTTTTAVAVASAASASGRTANNDYQRTIPQACGRLPCLQRGFHEAAQGLQVQDLFVLLLPLPSGDSLVLLPRAVLLLRRLLPQRHLGHQVQM